MVSHTGNQTDASSGRHLAVTAGIIDALLLFPTFVTFVSVMKTLQFCYCFCSSIQRVICLTADNIVREQTERTVTSRVAAAAGRSSLRSMTDNRQIQNNKRQSPGVCRAYLLIYAVISSLWSE